MSARFAFVTEWLDPQSGILWKHQLFYYPESKEVEMFDVKNRRVFLKRVKYEELQPHLLYIGNTVTVYTRQLKLVDYGDEYTRGKLSSQQQRTLALVKPDAVRVLGKILHAAYEAGLIASNIKMCKLSKAEAEQFYAVHRGKPFFAKLVDFMSSGRLVAIELVAADAIQKWRELIGPTDSATARHQAPTSLRAQFGTDNTLNACHGSDAVETAAAELAFFFGGKAEVGKCDIGKGTTLGVIKPHLVTHGAAGLVLDVVQDQFDITALQQFKLDKAAAAEFLEVYKGVVAPGEFHAMVEELTSGPCIAIEVADRDGADPVEAFRELCGPMDPEISRALRPQSIRAQFGLNKCRNGIHCTDLPEDGELEVGFFFSILQM